MSYVPQPHFVPQNHNFGPYPMKTTCQNCRTEITTVTTTESGLLTWLVSGGCVVFGCVLGCCLFPFCMDSCLNVVHSCPMCNAKLGLYKRL